MYVDLKKLSNLMWFLSFCARLKTYWSPLVCMFHLMFDARMYSCNSSFTFCLAYRLYTALPRLSKFVDNLTNWYVRMNRRRLRVRICWDINSSILYFFKDLKFLYFMVYNEFFCTCTYCYYCMCVTISFRGALAMRIVSKLFGRSLQLYLQSFASLYEPYNFKIN